MEFLAPEGLWLLLLVPLLIAAYLWSLKRRHRYVLRYSSTSLVREAMGSGPGIRRHIPPVLFLLALSVLAFAFARPYSTALLPFNDSTILLAIDASTSMLANDLKPTRFEAAKAAAKDFIGKQAANTRIGIVAFSGGAALVQAPTTGHDELNAALDRLYTQRNTAIGSGILTSLDAIAEALNQDLPSAQAQIPAVQPSRVVPAAPQPTPVAEGTYSKAIVVLLSDGQNTIGPLPLDAAKVAMSRGVRIFTIGVATAQGGSFGGGGFGGGGNRSQLDEVTLRQVAKLTGGKYYYAATETDLREVYASLDTQIVIKEQKLELTAYVMVAGAAFLLLGGVLSLIWFNRLP